MSDLESSHDDDVLAQELRRAFDLGPDATGFEVDLGAPRDGGSSAAPVWRGSKFDRVRQHRRGALLGDFEIVDELGRGGMGIVYRARQVSLSREVALKVLPDYAHRGPLAIQRFRNEARAAARLHHTNIVPIYAQGEEQGTFFYAMELVEGASLDAAIRCRTRLLSPSNPSLSLRPTVAGGSSIAGETLAISPNRTTAEPAQSLNARTLHRARQDYCHLARLLAGVADGLDHAHRAGVVHRDIKPQNLLVGPDDQLHITDFGLARLADAPGITVTGEVMGTPAYLSPEQARADLGAIDGRTDIYSLGVTLYELLTLHRPFEGETREQVLTGIKEREPAPPRTFDEHIPKDLQTICLKAMEKDQSRRYASAGSMAEDLRRFADGRPILSRPAGLVTKAIKWARRHKAASIAIVASGIVMLLAGGLAASVVAARHRDAEALIDEVYERLVYYDYRATPEQFAALDRAEELGGDLPTIQLLRALGKLFDRTNRDEWIAAREILAGIVVANPQNTDARYLHATALDRTGRPADAAAEIAIADKTGGATAAGWFFRGLALQFRDADEAIRSYEEANRLRSLGGDVFLQATMNLTRAHSQQMFATRTIDDLGLIVRPLEQIVAFGLYGSNPHNYLAIAHRIAGEVYTGSAGARDADQLAAEHFAESLKWARRGEEVDPNNALCFIAEGMTHQSQGDLQAAVAAFDAALVAADGQQTRLCEALHYRWRLHYWLNDYAAASADIDAYAGCAETEKPSYDHLYPLLILAEQGKTEEAREHAYALSANATTNALAVVWTATALRLLGDEASAQAHLDAHVDNLELDSGEIPEQSAEWIAGLIDLVRGRQTLAELGELAGGQSQPWRLTGEAEFHAAAIALASGEREAALEGFIRAWRSYDSAIRYTYHGELMARKMLADATWPNWLNRRGG